MYLGKSGFGQACTCMYLGESDFWWLVHICIWVNQVSGEQLHVCIYSNQVSGEQLHVCIWVNQIFDGKYQLGIG